LIAIARILTKRDLSAPEVQEALADLHADADVIYIRACRPNPSRPIS
jgi:hypothetical protein